VEAEEEPVQWVGMAYLHRQVLLGAWGQLVLLWEVQSLMQEAEAVAVMAFLVLAEQAVAVREMARLMA
jgi:hypothetical protein